MEIQYRKSLCVCVCVSMRCLPEGWKHHQRGWSFRQPWGNRDACCPTKSRSLEHRATPKNYHGRSHLSHTGHFGCATNSSQLPELDKTKLKSDVSQKRSTNPRTTCIRGSLVVWQEAKWVIEAAVHRRGVFSCSLIALPSLCTSKEGPSK